MKYIELYKNREQIICPRFPVENQAWSKLSASVSCFLDFKSESVVMFTFYFYFEILRKML